MAKIEIKSTSGAKTYEVLDDLVAIGADPKNHIRLKDPGAPAFAARLVRTGEGWRIEAAEAGRTFTLNGLTVGTADLEPGDVVKLDGLEIVFHSGDDAAARAKPAAAAPATEARRPAAAPTRAPAGQVGGVNARGGVRGRAAAAAPERGGRGGREERGERAERGGREPKTSAANKAGLWMIIGTISLGVVYLLYQGLQSTAFATDSAELVKTAKEYLTKGADLETCEKILAELDKRKPDAMLRAEVEKIRTGIAAAKQMSQLAPHIRNASAEHSILLNFVQTYLGKDKQERKHCREFIRLANKWIDKYRQLSEQVPTFADSEYRQVQDWIAKYKPTAKVEEPDTWDDVDFRADRNTRLTPNKRWREAIDAIDEFLQKNPGHEKAEAMKRSRLNQAENWLADKLQSADNIIAKKETDVIKTYIELFEFEIETGGLISWRSKLESKLDQLKSAVAAK